MGNTFTSTVQIKEGVSMEAINSNGGTSSNSIIIGQLHPLALRSLDQLQRHCFGDGQFPLSAYPTIVLHILSAYELDYQHLARLEATCSFFRYPANLMPYFELSVTEVAAYDMCQKRGMFNLMKGEEKEMLRQRCGGSWKLVLRFLMRGEACNRRGKFQAIAGPGHSIVLASNGDVYSFGDNNSGQLGHGNFEREYKPKIIRSLQGIRIIQAARGHRRTMLVSDVGKVYAFGKDQFADDLAYEGDNDDDDAVVVDLSQVVTKPAHVESLKGIFVVQVTIGACFTAVLSREGRVYTFCWGSDGRLGHHNDLNDREPRLLSGPLEEFPVVQIDAGHCFLLALAMRPNGMSVYSLGCGKGGKLGHGNTNTGSYPQLIEHFESLNLKPIAMAAGTWHAAVLGQDGRVCTWGWGNCGALGHGTEDHETRPKVVEVLKDIKARHIAAGSHTTFVVSEDGDTFSFGWNRCSNLGYIDGIDHQGHKVLNPELASSLKEEIQNNKIVQISASNTASVCSHTFALTESGELYAFGLGEKGQLGVRLGQNQIVRKKPEVVNIDL